MPSDKSMAAVTSSPQVLVVEDEVLIARDIRRRLERMGYRVTDIAVSGEAALRSIDDHPPDVVLMDIQLEGAMNGVEVAAHIRERHDIPLVYLTAHADAAMLQRIKITEPFGYILKPFRDRELQSNLEIALYRHAQQQRLRESEMRYRTLFQETKNPILIIDTQGNYVDCNAAALRFLACSREALLAKNVRDFIVPGQERVVEEQHAPLWEQGGTVETSYYVRGQVKVLELTITPSTWRGRRVIFGVGKDITEQRRAEEERAALMAQIQAQARQMRQIIDAVPAGVALLDARRRLALVNPVGEDHLAALSDVVMGGVLRRLGEEPLAPLFETEALSAWHEVVADNRHFMVTASPLDVDGVAGQECLGWVLVTRDVTQERDARRYLEQQERLAAVGQLAAGIAHDFNNILAVVSLYASMSLRMPGLPDKLYERLRIINQQSQRASALIQQILDFSRRAVLDRQPLDLSGFLGEQVQLLRRTLPENIHVALCTLHDVSGAPFTISADPTRIQQAMMNLAVNARDAMPDGGKLTIELTRLRISPAQSPPLPEMRPGDWVCVTVRDTGLGIPEQVLPHIFEPFFTTKSPDRGYGLGLAQVYGIIKQHDGHIAVQSVLEQGTTFTLYFPALPVPFTLSDAPLPPEDLPLGCGETILVVEDNPATREALIHSLELLNYRVLEAQDGQAALEVCARDAANIDLVLSDVVMPEMGGLALLRAIQRRWPALKTVLLTGHPLQRDEDRVQDAGAVAWLQKPVQLEQIAKIIAQVLAE